MGMTFGQFSQANRERCESPQGFNHPLAGWSTSDWMTATMGELGEASQCREEAQSVYLDLMAQSLGFSISAAAAEVFNAKSAEIGYPKQL